VLGAFEAAELEDDPAARAAWLTFAVVGAGPTGVEMAGQIAELARGMRGDFRVIDPSQAQILLIEGADRILGSFPPSLSAKGLRSLETLGVTARLNELVVGLDEHSVTVKPHEGEPETIPARTVVWAAGVVASELAGNLAAKAGREPDSAGRLEVEPDLSLPGHPEVLAIGDMVRVRGTDGESTVYPGVAPVAMQQGRHAAKVVGARLRGNPAPPFRYVDKGNLATIGRARAVADIKGVRLSGFIAWVTWLLIHIFYLIGFQNRVVVTIRWAVSFFTHGRSARLITYPHHED
jgi:NADH dehydrogenase